MKIVEITIEGTTPLICNRFTDEAQMEATSSSRSSAASGDRGTPQEQAEERLYIGTDGPMMPGAEEIVEDLGVTDESVTTAVATAVGARTPSTRVDADLPADHDDGDAMVKI